MGSIGCPILRGWLLVCCLGPGYLCAGAISKAEIAISILFPATTINEFGFSGPQSDLPVPITDWDGDGHVVHPTTQWPDPVETATVTKLQLDPLKLLARTGQIELETTNEGDASAEVTGYFSGRLVNLTAAPLKVTFTFDVQTYVYTHVDCDECDYATAEVGALFGFGDWNDFVTDSSTNGSLGLPFGFTAGPWMSRFLHCPWSPTGLTSGREAKPPPSVTLLLVKTRQLRPRFRSQARCSSRPAVSLAFFRRLACDARYRRQISIDFVGR